MTILGLTRDDLGNKINKVLSSAHPIDTPEKLKGRDELLEEIARLLYMDGRSVTDSRLLEVARARLVQLAQRAGLSLKQTYERESKRLRRRAGGYAHAKQFRCLRRVLKRQRTVLGRLLRDIERKLCGVPNERQTQLRVWLERAWRICRQRPKDKKKLYALHAPEVECIGKGKARQPYEFGVKVSLAITEKQGLIVGARAFPGNPYDGHTLAEQLEQSNILLQDLPGTPQPKTVLVDLGFRGSMPKCHQYN